MRMKLTLEVHDSWRVSEGDEENLKENFLALSMILSSISESQSHKTDIKKSARENWGILCTVRVGVDQVVQSKVQTLNRDFETLTMKKNEKVADYSTQFVRVISNL